ncbi:hypothetical protein JAAARDRAFT_583473 [Jaapia argillacea MUCL 33604]|uniref:BTB domain-containing protein n=1 Tax=Jaapia argillacea MUCL 33604 TaxID=933084 RepID=A0A067P6J2_9AGAM|nr:hypothetical protein JAAARDRAFT_583473 [Jaapia argillacea MUCL 33604]
MSSDNAAPKPTPRSTYPFNSPKADVILRSSDGVDFPMPKLLLSLSSSVFSDMFDLPQTNSDSKPFANSGDGLPVVDVSEVSHVLEMLLRPCFPWEVPVFSTVKELAEVLQAAEKYGMERIVDSVRKTFTETKYVENHPEEVYALACRFKFKDVARTAAKYTLRKPMPGDYTPAFEDISGGDIHRLMEYHKTCGNRVVSLVPEDGTTIECGTIWDSVALSCTTSTCQPSTSLLKRGPSKYDERRRTSSRTPRQWWWSMLHDIRKELQERPLSAAWKERATSPEALRKAMECETCRPRAPDEVKKMVMDLADKVGNEIAKVELQLNF